MEEYWKKIIDKKFRENIKTNPQQYTKELLGNEYDENIEYKIIESDKNTTHLVIPQTEMNIDISEITAAGLRPIRDSFVQRSTVSTLLITLSTVGCRK